MSFLDRFSVWEILVGLVLILVFNTVLFKFLVDWNQSQPLDEGESLATPPGSGSVTADALDSASSFATSVPPLPNRPRRRKHLQPVVTPAPAPASSGMEIRSEPVALREQPPVEVPLPELPSPLPRESSPTRVEEPVPSAPDLGAPRPAIAFAPEPLTPSGPVHELPPIVLPVKVAPEPFSPDTLPEEAVPLLPAAAVIPAFPASEPEVPVTGVSLPVLLNTALLAEPVPELLTNVTSLKTASEPPVSEPTTSEEAAAPARETPTSLQEVVPSSDLVLSSGLPAAAAAADPSLPSRLDPEPFPLADAPTADAPSAASPAPPARSGFRRAVTPARLFLTREFSSVRIRSRQMAAPETTATPEPVVTSELTPIPVVAEALESAPAPAPEEPAVIIPPAEPPVLRSSEPAPPVVAPPVAAPDVEPFAAEVHEALEVVVTPAAEVVPTVEAIPHAPAAELSQPAATPGPVGGLVLLPVAPEPPAPEPSHAPTILESSSFAAVPVAESKPEPEPVAAPVVEPEPVPETPAAPVEATETHAPVAPAAVEEPEVSAPVPVAPAPEPPRTVPVVDIAPEPVNLPPPVPRAQPAQPEFIVNQPIAPFIPIPHMATVQPVTGERATAQLTLSLEVSSLQLTPSFRLGSVQLRPLSNVVSLQLGAGVGPQPAANPLAANISFEIQSVQTGGDGQIQSLVLKPLSQARADTTPQPRLQVDAVQLTRGTENAPIQITPAQATSTAVQLLTTYAIAGIDFTPNFEIGTMRLEPSTRTVMLRLNQPGGTELPPAFEIANVQVGGDGQISLVQLTPTTL